MISDSIPKELILEIMLRLPAKSIARFHCNCFSTQPRLLFAIKRNGLWCFFSLPKHQSPYDNSSSSLVVAADFHMKFLPNKIQMYSSSENRKLSCCYASGLTYFYDMYSEVRVICNPITGRYASLPYLKRYRKELSFFGFDPIDKQFKVLCMAYPFGPDNQ
ncbi:putative F-box protein [Arabidopsis thaliana]